MLRLRHVLERARHWHGLRLLVILLVLAVLALVAVHDMEHGFGAAEAAGAACIAIVLIGLSRGLLGRPPAPARASRKLVGPCPAPAQALAPGRADRSQPLRL
jgi:beta-phosphoglucomutase-like phosphatase (HAD superfamily)